MCYPFAPVVQQLQYPKPELAHEHVRRTEDRTS